MTNLAFTALIKSKGYNKQRLADACDLSSTQMSNRINGANDWRWPEVGKACAALGITLDEFATYLQNSVQSLFSSGFAGRDVALNGTAKA